VWTVVYVAPTKSTAERLKNMLQKEGLLPMLRPVGLGEDGRCNIEILVPESEAEEASQVLGKALIR